MLDAETFNKWLTDPLVSRAAIRSGFDVNGNVLALLTELQQVMDDIEQKMPGIDFAELRRALNGAPETYDVPQLYKNLMAGGRSSADADDICHAIDPTWQSHNQTPDSIARTSLARIRRAKIIHLLKSGMASPKIALECGVSASRVGKIKAEEGLRTSQRGVKLDPERSRMIAAEAARIGQASAARKFGCARGAVLSAVKQVERLDAGMAY